jgi:hypothetical protein
MVPRRNLIEPPGSGTMRTGTEEIMNPPSVGPRWMHPVEGLLFDVIPPISSELGADQKQTDQKLLASCLKIINQSSVVDHVVTAKSSPNHHGIAGREERPWNAPRRRY